MARQIASVLLVALIVGAGSEAVAQPIGVEQPAYVPRTTAILPVARVYADPRLPVAETGVRDVSLRDLLSEIERMLASDPRHTLPEDSVLSSLLEFERAQSQQDLLFIARQSARLGQEHRRAFHLASAHDELDAALESYRRTPTRWTRPVEIAEVYHDLVFVHLERAQSAPEMEAEAMAAASRAMRQLIRLDPARRFEPEAYPQAVVSLHEQSYLELLQETGVGLQMTAEQASTLAGWLDVDQVVQLLAIASGDGLVLSIRIWDEVGARWALSEQIPVGRDPQSARYRLLAAVGRSLACQPLVDPPEPERQRAYESIVLAVGYETGFFLRSPTRRSLHAHGAGFAATWMISPSFGIHLAGSQWVARRDRDGDLVGTLDTTRGSVSALGASQVRWLRVFAHGGLEVTRHGRLRATTAFWCKVSEGELQEFEPGRECAPEDITNLDPTAVFGFTFGAGVDMHLGGPFWFRIHPRIGLYVAPRDDRSVNLPASLDVSFAYQF